MSRELDRESFRRLIESAPLASIDLLVTDPHGRLLVGRRRNEPAKGFYFVPGGRIKKDETNAAALERIGQNELGIDGLVWDPSAVVGVFDHHYETNALGEQGISTHYVVVAYRLEVDSEFAPPREQHDAYEWITPEELSGASDLPIHPNTRAYHAVLIRRIDEVQYALINSKRDAANSLVWQTPVVGLTGLAFLFTVLLAGDTSRQGRWIAAILAMAISAGTIQLTTRHRDHEVLLAKIAHRYEVERGLFEMNAKPIWNGRLSRLSSVRVWQTLFAIAFASALIAAIVVPDLG